MNHTNHEPPEAPEERKAFREMALPLDTQSAARSRALNASRWWSASPATAEPSWEATPHFRSLNDVFEKAVETQVLSRHIQATSER